MDYSEMNLSSWSEYLPRFKDLLRTEGVSPLGEPDENVEKARADDSAKTALTTIISTVPNLVFEGYRDWYSYQDEWVLRNLGQVLTSDEEHEILYRLDQGSPEALRDLLAYIADQRLSAWQAAAAEEFAQYDDADPEILKGLANTTNWEASRTPGTYYYTYVGNRYLFSDLAEGPIEEWETLPVREQLATDNAEPWGDSGWYCTPTGEHDLYGGAFVFAPDSEGPWMTRERAEAQLRVPPVKRRFEEVDAVPGHRGWIQGYDTYEDVWKYAQTHGRQISPDDAVWIALDEESADGTAYFGGPGSSDDGWVSYEPQVVEPAVVAEPPVAETPPPAAREEAARQLVEQIASIRADVMARMLEKVEQSGYASQVTEAQIAAVLDSLVLEAVASGQPPQQ